jgi:hypothetical protein
VDRGALVGGQPFERDRRVVAGLDRAQVVVGEVEALHAEASPCPLLDGPAPRSLG